MSRDEYHSIGPGLNQEALIASYGEPYEVKQLSPGLFEYHYIERIPLRPDYADEHHYYFTVQNGKVVSKRTTSSSSNVDVKFRNF
jgi:hypothetical protein